MESLDLFESLLELLSLLKRIVAFISVYFPNLSGVTTEYEEEEEETVASKPARR